MMDETLPIVPIMIEPDNITDEIGKIAQEGVEETVSDEVFSGYQHKEILPGCLPHPGDIVEAGSLAVLSPPPATYPLQESLPPEVISDRKLSSLQLEGVLYACQRHQMLLPSGSRAGFFIGDGAGVGKGRQIAGIILDNFSRGRTKHVWFSISTDLIVDARRDLGDIGCYVKVIEGCQQLDRETRVFGLPSDFKDGIIFSTYATLVSSTQKGGVFSTSRHSRLQQLMDWCGGDKFDGCLIFDECHKAKNFVPGKEQASTKVALAVTSIQRLLPKARVVYCSATGVTDVKNMAFMERLGLWGPGATFKSFDVFMDTVQKKGLGVAEMMAMEMKTTGMYLSRGLSFKQAQFETLEVPLTKEQMKMYNLAAHVWNEVRKSLEHALSRCGSPNSRVWSSFWGAHQRFFKQMCMAMKVPAIVEDAKKALDSGQCVVIGLQTTGEASMDAEISKNSGPLKNFVSLSREILNRFVEQHFPTVMEGKSSMDGPVEDDWCVTAKQMLIGFAKQIKLPDSPLDEIIDKLGGPTQVAEMTGRKGRIVRHSANEAPQYEARGLDTSGTDVESLNVRERNLFMEGEKLIAIISDAASTGISLHADQRASNQRRRVHVTMELPWSADKAVQQLGRSHRSNQTSGPLYKLVTTNLGGERRFAAAVARRLQSLGALTKGDRRAATGADLGEFNFDTPYGRQALKSMYTAVCNRHIANGVTMSSLTRGKMDFNEFNTMMEDCLTEMGLLEESSFGAMKKVKDNVITDVGRFLNRILGLKVEQQNMIFNYFCKCLEGHVSMAKKEGRYNEGLVDITASAVEMVGEPRPIFTAKNKSNNPTKHVVLTVDRGMSWERALTRLKNNPDDSNGFYCSRREIRGSKLYLLATRKENSKGLFKIARPNTGLSAFDEEQDDLFSKYIPLSQETAEKGWREQYDLSRNHCIHGPHCKAKQQCYVGARCYQMHLLCGGIVTMMSLLENTLNKYGPKIHLTFTPWKGYCVTANGSLAEALVCSSLNKDYFSKIERNYLTVFINVGKTFFCIKLHGKHSRKSESHLRVVRVQLTNGERLVGIRFPQMLIPLAEKEQQDQITMENFMLQSSQGSSQPIVPRPAESETNHKVVIEEISSVSQRLLTKATTPPVTIKNFFKPTQKNLKSNVSKSKNVTANNKAAEDIERDCNTGVKSGHMNGAISGNVQHKENILQATSSSPSLFTNNTTSSPSLSKKRSLSSSNLSSKAPPNKKVKQSNIMNMFSKQKSVKENQDEKQLTCPICNVQFEPGTLNTVINKHIDNCLIE